MPLKYPKISGNWYGVQFSFGKLYTHSSTKGFHQSSEIVFDRCYKIYREYTKENKYMLKVDDASTRNM